MKPYFDAPFVALAHQGGPAYGPNRGRPNTLAAFRTAVDLGYTHLETDVHASAEGTVWIHHDPTLADGRAIADLSDAELTGARVGSEPVPTLAQALEECAQARFNIDLKAAGAVAPVAEVIRRFGAEHRVCVGAFSNARLRQFRRLLPQVATSVGPIGVAYAAWLPVAPRLAPPAGDAFQIPQSHRIGPVRVPTLTEQLVANAHARGQQVHVWTINDEATMEHLIDAGVDGIVTDAIEVLATVLRRRRLWP
ncbi:glycerophosphodiester phosphodiesterase family protein [Parenemella sanctibonifatiensis]|uniref:Glycerophosphodiester phosphodiesterase n=1 Tax=Parenemella sanctibonifatiensis TaxID=2016505 RepID=A0A255EP37_9ACTN|nr:glycerophosphodiester phosphodiesterase family protein [Parenemella sanctibonifatiensis]OYN91232.1 glycerophosphodiester phosphodiesterase [Parenemella sanctibonifatiensis]